MEIVLFCFCKEKVTGVGKEADGNIADGNVKQVATVENGSVVPQKVQHRITTPPSNSTPRTTPKRTKNRGSNEHLHTNVLRNTSLDRQTVETNASVSRRPKKQNMPSV